jgi:hypothetical protein
VTSRDLSTVLWRRGRLSLVLEPRDLWLGLYVAPGALYVCLLPCVAVRWERRKPDAPARSAALPDPDGYVHEWMPGTWREPGAGAVEP